MARKIATTLAVLLLSLSAAAASIDKRTVGGEDATDGEIPFMVSLQDEKGTHQCGGSLLDSTTILTAAHCVSGAKSVKAGTANIQNDGVVANIASSKIHPNYEPGGVWNDIAILKLSTPIEKNKTISYAVLPGDGSDPAAASIAMSAGWGMNDKGEISPHQLSKVVLPVIAREHCPHSEKAAEIIAGRDTLVCTGGNGKSLCHKDSGGPLFEDKTLQLIGVASFTITRLDCRPENRMLFVRVGSYISFIKENLGTPGSG